MNISAARQNRKVVQGAASAYLWFMKCLLLLSATCLLVLCSCESEYEQRLRLAKELIRQEVAFRNSEQVRSHFSANTMYTFQSLHADIRFHAHVSGNEELFFQELHRYEQQLQRASDQQEVLLTKFP